MKITQNQLRRIIKEELLREAKPETDTDISTQEFIKGIKSAADDLAAGIPAKLNDDVAAAIKGLSALAKFDKAKFDKISELIASYSKDSLEKVKK